MRGFWMAWMAVCLAAGTVSAESASAPMKALFEEMKTHAEADKQFREEKKAEIQALERQIDTIRAEAKAKGTTGDPATVKPLQIKRLNLLGEVAKRDVDSAERGVQMAKRKLEIAKDNLAAFKKKKAEAEGSLKA